MRGLPGQRRAVGRGDDQPREADELRVELLVERVASSAATASTASSARGMSAP